VASLAKQLHAKGKADGQPARGLVSVCAAGGQGVVAILESL
jgi:acetyl-CoA C-acetyltransferase